MVFVRSIREEDFSLYVSSLKHVVKWHYPCDYYHYATSVLNKDDESGLARWELCLHDLSLIIKKYGCTPEVELDFEPLKHHEDSEAFQNQFSAHVSRLKTSILTNPFKLNKLTVLNNEKATVNDIVYDDISKMSKLGEEQFKAFWMDRLLTCKVLVRDPILLNLLNLPGNPNKATEKDPVLTAAMMEKLKKAGEARSELVENLLRTERFEILQSLSENQYSSIYYGTKSHVTSQFRTLFKPSFHGTKNGIVIELSMLLRKKRVSCVKSFEDYARFLYHVITKSTEPYSRLDVVTDKYFSESLKEEVRDNRGSDGLTFPFNDSTPIPANFETDFLTNVTNKTNLNEYLAQKFIKLHDNDKQTICITYNDTVISNDNNVLTKILITLCTSEEADSRIIGHAINLGVNKKFR